MELTGMNSEASNTVQIQQLVDQEGTRKLPKVRRKGRDVVHIKDAARLASVLVSSQDEGALAEAGKTIKPRPLLRHPSRHEEQPRQSFNISIDGEALIENSLHAYILQKCVDPADPEVAMVQRMVAIHEEREDAVVRKGFLPFLRHDDFLRTRRRELLHKRWTENVYYPLHKKVIDQLQGPHYDDTKITRHMMYTAYLEHMNRKKDAFLDEIVDTPIDYRYVQPDRLWLHARTHTLVDPLITAGRRRKQEDRLLDHMDDIIDRSLPPLYDHLYRYRSVS